MSTAPRQSQQQRHRRLRLRRVFDLFDCDGDGIITQAELSGALGRLGLALGAQAGTLDSVVASYIAPGMPGLRFSDFEALHDELDGGEGEGPEEEDEEREMREAFAVFDENGDGYISAAELQAVLGRMGMPEAGSMARVQDMIAAHDRDSDGRVDFHEFKAMMADGQCWSDHELSDPVYVMKATREALTLLDIPKQLTMLPGHGWRPPDAGCVKINTDGAINFADGKGGVGGVARSSDRLIGAWSKPLLGITDPLIAESMALREGVLFARLRGISRVIMETDCMEVLNLWKTRHNSRSIVVPLLEEIGELASSFISFDIQHVIRTSNYPAHLCAKRASTLNVTESWMDETPSFLFSCLLADCPASAYV